MEQDLPKNNDSTIRVTTADQQTFYQSERWSARVKAARDLEGTARPLMLSKGIHRFRGGKIPLFCCSLVDISFSFF